MTKPNGPSSASVRQNSQSLSNSTPLTLKPSTALKTPRERADSRIVSRNNLQILV